MPDFIQQGPQLTNAFDDPFLFDLLSFYANPVYQSEQKSLYSFGQKVITKYHPHALMAEQNPPIHEPYSPWGKRVDQIIVHPSWEKLHAMVAEDGIVACGYERKFSSSSRLLQMLRIMVLHPSSAFYTCPLAMTDGAAKVLELNKHSNISPHIFKNLTSRDSNNFWTAGQWMTEKVGGSDVSQSETYAEKTDNENYKLFGKKWFTSAITANISMALAQHTENGQHLGLSLFMVELKDDNGELQNIEVQRLKNKLGTKALPTAELHLNGAPAKLIGTPGKGVKSISSILNISRVYNAACSVGALHRGLLLAYDYSKKRKAFGKTLSEHPLHRQTLIKIRVLFEANLHLLFFVSKLLGKDDLGELSETESKLIRLLTPVLKLWTAKSTIQSISEICESFGGAGYIEDTEIPRLLRDSQVFPIWEGTTNILSLDTLRVFSKKGFLDVAFSFIDHEISRITDELKTEKDKLIALKDKLSTEAQNNDEHGPNYAQTNARAFSYGLAALFSGLSMLQFAESKKQDKKYLANYQLFMSGHNSIRFYSPQEITQISTAFTP